MSSACTCHIDTETCWWCLYRLEKEKYEKLSKLIVETNGQVAIGDPPGRSFIITPEGEIYFDKEWSNPPAQDEIIPTKMLKGARVINGQSSSDYIQSWYERRND